MEIGVWIALGTLMISAATLIAGAISMNNKARTSYVDLLKGEVDAQRSRIEIMGSEHEGLKSDYRQLKADFARCMEDCRRKDERVAELTRANHDLLLQIAMGKRIKDLGRDRPSGEEGQ